MLPSISTLTGAEVYLFSSEKTPFLESSSSMPWIEVAPGAPYFITEEGEDWTILVMTTCAFPYQQ